MTTTAPAEADFGFARRRRITSEPLGYVAPLDGLRAIAVIGVLLYHARFSWIPGGYLGVSTFFTLSGFLITSLMLREWSRVDSIDLRGFWVRRFRRLLPASWCTIGLVIVMGALGVWSDDQLRSLRGDVIAALAEVANWHFIFAGRSYGEAFSAPSPLEHFWSLAVEQQFYLVLPVIVLAVLSRGRERPARHRLNLLVAVLACLLVVSAALNWKFAATSTDRAYFGTDTRMAELLLGALLACGTLRRLRITAIGERWVAIGAGFLGLAGTFWLWHAAPLGASWMYPWGLLITALCTSCLIFGSLQTGPLASLLSLPPLLWIGKISYGIYLLHWPVFLWLSPARVRWSPVPLFGLRMAVTLVAATVLFRLVEDPIRRGGRLTGRRAALVAVCAAVALIAGDLVVTRNVSEASSLSRAATMPPPADASTTTAPPPPLRTMVVGDAIAQSLGTRLAGVDGYEALTATTPDCGLTLGGWVARGDNRVERDVERCRGVRDNWIAAVNEATPEVVLVQGTIRDATDRRLTQEGTWAGPGDPVIDDFLTTDIAGLVDDLSESGAEVVLLAMPPVTNAAVPAPLESDRPPADPANLTLSDIERAAMASGVPTTGFRENDPARIERLNAVLAAVAASRGIRYFDPSEVMSAWEGGPTDPQMRPDGVGFSDAAARDLGEWMLPRLRTRVEPAAAAEAAPVLSPQAPLPEAPAQRDRRRVAPGRDVQVLVVGDSVGFNVGFGLSQVSSRTGIVVENAALLGCPVARGGSYRFKQDLEHFAPSCDWATFFPQQLNAVRPDVVVLSSGIWEVVDRRLPGDDRFRNVGEPGVDRYLLREFLAAIDVLGSDGANVVVLTQTHFHAGLNQGFSDLPESDPARTDRLNELWREAVSLRPGVTTLVDVQSWLAQQPGGEINPAIRPDGLHFTDEFSPVIADWLAPQLVQAAQG